MPSVRTPIPPAAVWDVVLADGSTATFVAHRLTINSGALGFRDKVDDYFIAYAPGEWRRCERSEPPKSNT